MIGKLRAVCGALLVFVCIVALSLIYARFDVVLNYTDLNATGRKFYEGEQLQASGRFKL